MSEWTIDLSRSMLHESPRIKDRICNGCLRLEVLERRTGRDVKEMYYCKHRFHGYFDPKRVRKCADRIDHVDLGKPRFNRAGL